jgi:hypothetical protein
MSEREYAQLKRMLGCQKVQEGPLGAGQQVFIGAPKIIESLAHETATLGVTRRADPAWPDAHSVWSLHRDFPDERHMSRFEFCSFDRNGHLKVLVHALEWPDAPIKIDRTHLGVRSPRFALLTTRSNTLLELTGRHSASVRSIPVSIHTRPNASGWSWPDAPPRPIDPSRSLSLWRLTGRAGPANDRTRWCKTLVTHTWLPLPLTGRIRSTETASSSASGHPSDLRSPPFLSTMT